MLRHPVERVVSLYYYIRKTPDNPLFEMVTSAKMALDEFLESGTPQMTNHQTRLISGLEENFTGETLPIAKKNLVTRFTAAGLVEKFDESLLLFKRLLGWKTIFYVKGNVTKGRPRKHEILNSTIRLIEKQNALDLEFYEFAEKRFKELVSEQGASFPDEVLSFRRSNRIYAGFTKGRDVARRAMPDTFKTAIEKILARPSTRLKDD